MSKSDLNNNTQFMVNTYGCSAFITFDEGQVGWLFSNEGPVKLREPLKVVGTRYELDGVRYRPDEVVVIYRTDLLHDK